MVQYDCQYRTSTVQVLVLSHTSWAPPYSVPVLVYTCTVLVPVLVPSYRITSTRTVRLLVLQVGITGTRTEFKSVGTRTSTVPVYGTEY